MDQAKLDAVIRDIPDFPKEGIIFKDITPLLKNGEVFGEVIEAMADRYADNPPDHIVVVESRGFIFGSALAYKFGCGIVPVRKKGKLPYKTLEVSYDLEYGSAAVEIHEDALNSGDRVVVVDDLLATGGTACAAVELVRKLGAEIIGVEFLIELAFLNGRDKLKGYPVNTLMVVD